MTIRGSVLLFSFLALAVSPAWAASPQDDDSKVEVAGRLVDVDGAPVSGGRVATYWSLKPSPPVAYEAMTSDDGGAFTGAIDTWRYPVALTAYSSDGALAGVALVEESGLDAIEIVMRKSVHVTAEVTCEGLGGVPEWVNASFSVGKSRIGDSDTSNGRLSATLPQGEITWSLYDSWFSSVAGARALDGTATEVDLGTIDIPAAFLATKVGKELPEWSVSASRGVPLDQSGLVAHRGKWLLIEFWGYW